MKKVLVLMTLVLAMSTQVNAQNYNNAIGLRGGFGSGITFKHMMGSNAFEGILSTRWSGFAITGLYEFHNAIPANSDFVWYYGIGGHFGSWDGNKYNSSLQSGNQTFIGIDAILGIEYTFPSVPINLSIDWKPGFNLIGDSRFYGDGGALSIRYAF